MHQRGIISALKTHTETIDIPETLESRASPMEVEDPNMGSTFTPGDPPAGERAVYVTHTTRRKKLGNPFSDGEWILNGATPAGEHWYEKRGHTSLGWS